MCKVLVFLTLSTAMSAAAPIEADYLWEAADQSLTMAVPSKPGQDLQDLTNDPDRLLAPFLAMVGEEGVEGQLAEDGLRAVREEATSEVVQVNGQACRREVTHRIEVVLDFSGVLTRTDTEMYGQAYSQADGSRCDLPPGGDSAMSVLPGSWRAVGASE